MSGFEGKDRTSRDLWLATLSPEQRALRDELVRDAVADMTKDIDPLDEDADYMRELGAVLAEDLVDAIVSARLEEQRKRIPSVAVTPAEYSKAIHNRLAEWEGAGLIPPCVISSSFDSATKTITTRIVERAPIVVIRQVAEGPALGEYTPEVTGPPLDMPTDPDDID